MDDGYCADVEEIVNHHKRKTFQLNTYNNKIYEGLLEWLTNDHTVLQVNEDDLLMDNFNYKCGYCLLTFSSRNKLFNHLGFCNVNINQSESKINESTSQYYNQNDFLTKYRKTNKNKRKTKKRFLRWAKREKKFQKSILHYLSPIKEVKDTIKNEVECDDLVNSFTRIRINESFQKNKNARDDLVASMRNIKL